MKKVFHFTMIMILLLLLLISCGKQEVGTGDNSLSDSGDIPSTETGEWDLYYSPYPDGMIEVTIDNEMMMLWDNSPVIVEWGEFVDFIHFGTASTLIEIDGYEYTGIAVNYVRKLLNTEYHGITAGAEKRKEYFDMQYVGSDSFEDVILIPREFAKSIKSGEKALLFLDRLEYAEAYDELCGIKIKRGIEYLEVFPLREDETLIVDALKYDKDHDGDYMVEIMGAFEMANHILKDYINFTDGISIEILEEYLLKIRNDLELTDRIVIHKDDLWKLDYYGIDWRSLIK